MLGSVDESGTLRDQVAAIERPWESTVDVGGLGMLPGAYLRLLWVAAPHGAPAPVFGVQASHGQTSGTDATYTQQTLCLLGGIGWQSDATAVNLLAKGGYAAATLDRSLRLSTGAYAEEVDVSTDLAGWTAGVEMAASQRWGAFDVGMALGIDTARLNGSDSWTSSSGRFTANEDATATVTCIYTALTIGGSW